MNKNELNDLIFKCLSIIVTNEGGFANKTDVKTAYNYWHSDIENLINNFLKNT